MTYPSQVGWISPVCLAFLLSAEPALAQVSFERDIRPLLAEHCLRCHGPKKHEGGLRLDVRRRTLQGGDSGPAVVAGASARSELFRRVSATDAAKRMPPSGEPLHAEQIAQIKTWLDQGAHWPDELAGKDAADDHWAFRPVRRPHVSAVKVTGQVRNAIDQFVLARLERDGLTLSSEADRPTLLRRLYLDLLGLPPPDEEVGRIANPSYELVVDRLLASPHFGERWGRHWLDLARFAESDGYENDRLRPDAWRFRDWVIDAVNRDLPFDQFTVEQLAGDLLPGATTAQKVATGFHRNTLWNSAASGDKEEFRTLAVKDRTETTGTVWMGLTVGCAQCHSHKYDPLSQREYYQLYAFFNATDSLDLAVPPGKAQTLQAVQRTTHVLKRGSFLQKGEAVVPAVPAFLSPPNAPGGKQPDRLDLARWLIDPRHPLTARVAVNHVWQHLFGHGLVHTPENFGLSGEPPTHPELLDWLAAELVRLNWSRKALIRTIVLSATYRQASDQRAELTRRDPDNHLLGRQNRFRVEAETVRDLALAAGGLLDRKLGGPSVVPPFPDGLLAFRFQSEALKLPGPDRHRRGVYVHVQRTLTHPSLAAFDGTDGNQTCVRRARSTTPVQALTLLNDPVFLECAQALAGRLRQGGADRDERLRAGFQLCLGRLPTADELAVLAELVETQRELGAAEDAVWLGVARTLLNLDEFIHRR